MNEPMRQWHSYTDDDDETWLFDSSFLMSNWTCIYGRGCKGVLDHDATELQHGCCTHGAHFSDNADRKRVKAAIKRLTPENWQNHDIAEQYGGPVGQTDEGGYATHTHDGVCIFHNRPGFAGGQGCALHGAALAAGERPMDWKPDVCWQLPLRLETRTDENERTTYVLREWQRKDWGEGGNDFHWWCTETHEAFVGDRAVYQELRDEIIELIGPGRYAWFVENVAGGEAETVLAHPARRTSSA